nr:T9SS type A sorting domain-containing protein [Bacteroidota bacterium]
MRKSIALFVLLNGIYLVANGQKEYNNWFFGAGCGLDFSAGAPVYLPGGQISTDEGCSAMSDKNGNLLMYTDGLKVLDKTHNIMPNGSGLQGNSSSTQSALIVPAPGSNTLYYIFTTAGNADANYNIVDMTLNGGMGDVTIKNSLIFSGTTERVCAVKHANGVDYWILFHVVNSNEYKAYLLTSAGLNLVPVITNIGTVHTGGGDDIGYMKPNFQGTKIAIGVRYQDMFDLLDFDNTTGVLSNVISLSPYPYAYGVEFSLDGKILYTSNGLGAGTINQFDITSGNAATINASVYLVANVTSLAIGCLQMGPDLKIYQTAWGNNQIGCINNPGVLGVGCNFIGNTINMPTQGRAGLPNCIPDLFKTVTVTNLCFGDTTFFTLSDTGSILVASWNFDDPNSGNNTSSNINTSHLFSAPGNYSVQFITVNQSLASDTQYIDVTIIAPPAISLGNDTTLCNGQSLLLNAGNGFANYLWQNGNTTATYTATVSGNYNVNVISVDGCKSSDSIDVTFIVCAGPVAALSSSDTLWCDKTCIDFFDLSQNDPTSWTWYFQGASPSTSTDQNPTGICYNNYGSFDVTLVACNGISCDSLFLDDFVTEFQLPTAPVISFINDTLFSTPAFAYQWYNINNINVVLSTQNYFVPTVDGSYFVLISDSNGCTVPSTTFGFYTGLFQNSILQNSVSIIEASANQFDVTFHRTNSSSCAIKIYDTKGSEVFEKALQNFDAGKTFRLDLSSLSKGLYIIEIVNSNIDQKQKLIIK